MSQANTAIFQKKGEQIFEELNAVLAKHGLSGSLSEIVFSDKKTEDMQAECKCEWTCWDITDAQGNVVGRSCGLKCEF